MSAAPSPDLGLGRIGIWSYELRNPEFATERVLRGIEACGIRAVWFPGGFDPSIFDDAADLQARSALQVGTSIVAVTAVDAETTIAGLGRVEADRFVLGLGVSHPEFLPGLAKPVEAMAGYVDRVRKESDVRTVLGTLGPRMMGLARDRGLGVHPYLVTPGHTRSSRDLLGPGVALAPQQTVLFDADPASARATARAALEIYLGLGNYVRNFRRMGFDDDDFVNGGSDRLVDSIVAWGTDDDIAGRLAAHLDAGAGHVVVSVLAPAEQLPDAWARVASLVP
jgi:probable F420-dependent oxidoreductase